MIGWDTADRQTGKRWKTKAQIKAEDIKRANTFKVLLSNDKVDELAYRWGAKFSRGTK